jgi:DNA modification methylase
VLELLSTHTYEQVRELTGWSRGRIHGLALKCGARKTEERIRRRASERAALQREAFEEMLGSTVTADVLDFMGSLPDRSISLFVTSVPYNLGKKYGGAAGADAMRHVYYHGWLMQIVSEMARTLKDGGTVVAQLGTTRDDDGAIVPLDVMLFEDFKRAGLTFQNRIIWPTHSGLTPKGRLAERCETALVFSRGTTPTFNRNACRIPQLNPGKRAFKGPNIGRLSGHPLGASLTDLWNDAALRHLGHNDPEKTSHCCQWPVAFAKRSTLLFTNPDDIVCDPFCGSGSSHVAAIEAGRRFIGCDLFYAEIREPRIAAAKPDTFTPFTGVTEKSFAIWEAEARRVEATPASPMSARADARLLLDFLAPALFQETD